MRTSILHIRMTEAEMSLVNRAAHAVGMSKADWARAALQRQGEAVLANLAAQAQAAHSPAASAIVPASDAAEPDTPSEDELQELIEAEPMDEFGNPY